MDNYQEFVTKGIAAQKAIDDMGFGKPKCKNCQQLQSENERLKDRLSGFMDNVLMILENDNTLDVDTKQRLEYEHKKSKQVLKGY